MSPAKTKAKRTQSNSTVLYMIGEAAKIAGVSPTTVRLWEREGLVESQRSDSGYRYFGNAELALLRRVAYLRKVERLNTEGIRRALAEENGKSPAPRRSGAGSIGARLRRLRQSKGMTLEQAAEASDLSPSFLSSLERDQTRAAPGTLHRLVGSYGSTLSAIVREDSPGPIQLKKPGKRRRVSLQGFGSEQLVDGQTMMDASICTVEPGAELGKFLHDGEEVVYVLEGTLEISFSSGEKYTLGAGDSLYHPSTIEHEWRNPTKAPTELIWVSTPPTY